jgi:hypothetical protein
MIPWDVLDHVSLVVVLGSPILYLAGRVSKLIKERDEDHKRITALWREHGYNGWNGTERRKKTRY